MCYSAIISARTVTLRETKRCHISTVSTSTICLCLSLSLHAIFVLIAAPLCFSASLHGSAGRMGQSRAPCSFSCPQFLFFLLCLCCLPTNRTTKCSHRALPPHTQACKLVLREIKRRMHFFFRSVFRLSLADPEDCISNFLTSISGRARSRETLVLSSLVRIATASSLSWMSTPFIWKRKRRIKLS